MLLQEIITQLNEFCSPSLAEDWDNPGLQAGRTDLEVSSVYLAVDATSKVIEDAIRSDCDLILTHHPLLFNGVKHVTDKDYIGKRILTLLQNDMALFSMHTNFDVLAMAAEAADRLGLLDTQVLEVTYEDAISREGLGRIGALPEHMSLEECAQLVREKFAIPHVRFYGDPDQPLVRCAILPGSGHDEIDLALEKGADVMITGDITHHVGLDAVEKGICVIDAGHYGIEKIFVPYMKEFLEKQMPALEVHTAPEMEPFNEI
ncbi:MAG TPA: Nif3-like dinuclear metal center hexameric protein [Lachnospiraceae bacterium]|jgi:dinuclear metal center YbgI/SA1388 family protein|nr:Nif3-like dinuclear metal center hexameric protein [Lachnospiraceae bacterium]